MTTLLMRRLLLLGVIAGLGWAALAEAQVRMFRIVGGGLATITVVETATFAFADDPTVAFSSAPASGNRVIVLAMIESEANTISLTGAASAVTTLAGPLDADFASTERRAYAFCFTGDGADNLFAVASSSGHRVFGVALNISSGAPCASIAVDSDVTTITTSTTSHSLTTDLTGLVNGGLVGGLIAGDSGDTGAANWSAGSGYTPIPSDNTEISTWAQGEYKALTSTSGTEDTTWTSAASEKSFLLAVGLQAG